jgi:hypothetical protein
MPAPALDVAQTSLSRDICRHPHPASIYRKVTGLNGSKSYQALYCFGCDMLTLMSIQFEGNTLNFAPSFSTRRRFQALNNALYTDGPM